MWNDNYPGVKSPYKPFQHNWKGGQLEEGSLFHGPNYTKVMFGYPRIQRPIQQAPLNGLGINSIFNQSLGEVMINIPDISNQTGVPIIFNGPPDTRVHKTQRWLNRELVTFGYNPIPVTSILDRKTCGAISWAGGNENIDHTGTDEDILLVLASALACIDRDMPTKKGETNPELAKGGKVDLPFGIYDAETLKVQLALKLELAERRMKEEMCKTMLELQLISGVGWHDGYGKNCPQQKISQETMPREGDIKIPQTKDGDIIITDSSKIPKEQSQITDNRIPLLILLGVGAAALGYAIYSTKQTNKKGK